MRRFGKSPERGRVYKERPGAYGLIVDRGRVLVTEERALAVEIQLPGGGIDPGETPQEALYREGLEETGWRLRVIRKLGVYQRYTYMPDYDRYARKICHMYLCRPGLKLSEPLEAHHRALWMSPDEAVERLASEGDAFYTQMHFRGFV